MKKFIILINLIFFASLSAQSIDYKTYIEYVKEKNLSYAAERLNVGIAEAELQAAKVFNDPQLSLEYADNDDRRMLMGRSVSVELSKTFSVGKRGANIDLARSEKELNEALLEDYFRNLRADATLAYIEALKRAELYRIKEKSAQNIRALAASDSIRFALGEINEADALQSAIEAESTENELIQARSELLNACAALAVFTGSFSAGTPQEPTGKLAAAVRDFDAATLLQTALDNRADLAAALKNTEVAERQLKVARRERNTDFDLALGYNYNTEVRNEIAPAPKFNGVTVGVSIPLKLSNFNRGTVSAAKLRQQQAETTYRQAEVEVQTEVMNSLRQYRASVEQVKTYQNGLHRKAENVLNARIYSYRRGETSRSEVYIAQQTFDNLQAAYIETIANNLSSLVELDRSVGIWEFRLDNE
ncbi:MAG: TolC family protein [Dysgonamonadaceae bacterium]|jgi:cobalt-zinc-cadmium efflux system outer membrane protein|nr:TolC family protein [Dysgonamonadaceae bacterium]